MIWLWIFEIREKACRALYYLGGAFLIVNFAVSIKAGSIFYFTPFLYLSACMFAVGFITWTLPFIRSAVSSRATNFVFTIAQSLIVIFSLILARETVSSATGLPPQDFDLTVIGVSFLYYLYFWLLITSVLAVTPLILALAVFPFIYLFILFVPLIVLFIVYPVAFLVSVFSPRVLPKLELSFSNFNVWVYGLWKDSNKYSGHYFGALAVFAYSISAAAWVDSNDEVLERAARQFAYYADCHVQKQNPYVCTNMRVNVHANGVISYARKDEVQGALITAYKLIENPSCNNNK